jgi:hypothetical protein
MSALGRSRRSTQRPETGPSLRSAPRADLRTNRPYAGAAIAYAAFARVRSIGIPVAQQFSPNRPLDRAKMVEIQTDLSQRFA